MTENEAIFELKDIRMQYVGGTEECKYIANAIAMAIQALEENQQYRAIGTPEECRAAAEKQKARKIPSAWCPCCGKYLTSQKLEDVYHCVYCGQKLDWGDEE